MSGRSFEMTTHMLIEASQTAGFANSSIGYPQINEIDESDEPHANPNWHAGVFKNPLRHDVIAFRTPGRIRKADLQKDITERRLKFRDVISTTANNTSTAKYPPRNLNNASTIDIPTS
jgi:hypothetical protein